MGMVIAPPGRWPGRTRDNTSEREIVSSSRSSFRMESVAVMPASYSQTPEVFNALMLICCSERKSRFVTRCETLAVARPKRRRRLSANHQCCACRSMRREYEHDMHDRRLVMISGPGLGNENVSMRQGALLLLLLRDTPPSDVRRPYIGLEAQLAAELLRNSIGATVPATAQPRPPTGALRSLACSFFEIRPDANQLDEAFRSRMSQFAAPHGRTG